MFHIELGMDNNFDWLAFPDDSNNNNNNGSSSDSKKSKNNDHGNVHRSSNIGNSEKTSEANFLQTSSGSQLHLLDPEHFHSFHPATYIQYPRYSQHSAQLPPPNYTYSPQRFSTVPNVPYGAGGYNYFPPAHSMNLSQSLYDSTISQSLFAKDAEEREKFLENLENIAQRKRVNSWTRQEEAFLIGIVVSKYLAQGSLFSFPTSSSTNQSAKKRKGSAVESAQAKSKSEAIEKCWQSIKSGFDLAWNNFEQKHGQSKSCERTSAALARHYKVMKTRLKQNKEKGKQQRNATLSVTTQDARSGHNPLHLATKSGFHELYRLWREDLDVGHCLIDPDFFIRQEIAETVESKTEPIDIKHGKPYNSEAASSMTAGNLTSSMFQSQKTYQQRESDSRSQLTKDFRQTKGLKRERDKPVDSSYVLARHPSLQSLSPSLHSFSSAKEAHTQQIGQSYSRVNSWTTHEEILLVGIVVDRFIKRGSLVSPRNSTSSADADCWTSIKAKYDLASTRFASLTQSLHQPQTRTVNALSRHYKVLRAKILQHCYSTYASNSDININVSSNSLSPGEKVMKLWEMYDVWLDTYNKDGVLLRQDE